MKDYNPAMKNMIHIINEQGEKEAIPASNSINDLVNRNVTVDLEWYKEHGYCSADEFFKNLRNKYYYTHKIDERDVDYLCPPRSEWMTIDECFDDVIESVENIYKEMDCKPR